MALTSWATHMIQWPVQRDAKPRGGANPTKAGLSSDCRLQFVYMKLDLLVNAHQHGALNTFSGLVLTARQTTKVGNARRLPVGGRRQGQ